MDTRSGLGIGAVARRLGVSVPTVRRAVDADAAVPRTPDGHRRLSPDRVARLVRRFGFTPRVEGLSRTDVQVLAVLSRRPLGMRSVRAVAQSAALSPTATSAALDRLGRAGLVRADREMVSEGTAKEVTVWRLVIGPRWLAIAPTVTRTVLPVLAPQPPPSRVPRRFWHLFWNAAPASLTMAADADYIALRMVLGPDLAARSWALWNLPPTSLAKAAKARGASPAEQAMIGHVLVARS